MIRDQSQVLHFLFLACDRTLLPLQTSPYCHGHVICIYTNKYVHLTMCGNWSWVQRAKSKPKLWISTPLHADLFGSIVCDFLSKLKKIVHVFEAIQIPLCFLVTLNHPCPLRGGWDMLDDQRTNTVALQEIVEYFVYMCHGPRHFCIWSHMKPLRHSSLWRKNVTTVGWHEV